MTKDKQTQDYTEEQLADIQTQITEAQEERDYVNAVDRNYRDRALQLTNSYTQNIEGITIVDKFEVDAWKREWNAFRERHNMPSLDFEALKERAARRVRQ